MIKIKDYKSINDTKVINELMSNAIPNLKNRFKELQINVVEVNNLQKSINKISREFNKESRIKKLQAFLLVHGSSYLNNDYSPLNIFSRDCSQILKNNFIQ